MVSHTDPMGRSCWTPPERMRADDCCSLNVARLAKVPEAVLKVATVKSKELEEQMQVKKLSNLYASIFDSHSLKGANEPAAVRRWFEQWWPGRDPIS